MDRYTRTARLATRLAHEQGEIGTYYAHQPERPGEPDCEILWVTGEHLERVGCTVRDGTVVVAGDALHTHEPFLEAGDRLLGKDLSVVGAS